MWNAHEERLVWITKWGLKVTQKGEDRKQGCKLQKDSCFRHFPQRRKTCNIKKYRGKLIMSRSTGKTRNKI